MKAVWLAAGFCAVASVSSAQELVLGAGYTDFNQNGANDSAILSLEYHATPFYENGNFTLGWGGVVSAQAGGDIFVGGGLVSKYAFSSDWSAEASVMPGAYFEDSALTDLGHTLEFRSLIGLAYHLPSGDKISLAVLHKSNAGLGNINPGANTVLLRWHRSF
ncbi:MULTISPECIES: acyloxyacyl hydrolase [Shimia]|uniref:acyloxyacyl hydrolase n=1 Tax=Shimia TaxID=573139 RepID=UPI001FB4B84D|nr:MULTISPECIES: acyloxyacyl hydrolase [Shimia]MDV4145823.1 acyloxyacyl hydrolase [Shimia sp. FJ5]